MMLPPCSIALRNFAQKHRSKRVIAGFLMLLGACDPGDDPWSGVGSVTLRDGVSTEVVSMSLGQSTTCATLLTGEAKCWGRGDEGRLGRGTGQASSEAEPGSLEVLALGLDAAAMATNGAQTFVVLGDGRVRAFGVNDAQQLGLGHAETVGDDETPADAQVPTLVPLGGAAQQVAAGEGFACARLDDGRVQCWGRGDAGQLGREVGPGVHAPGDVVLGGLAVEITAGVAHACARLETDAIRCWGAGDRGQLGDGIPVAEGRLPATAGDVPVGGPVRAVVAGGHHTCALLDGGRVRCWGDNDQGQLGYGHTWVIGDDEPAGAAGDVPLDGPAVSVVAGLRHTCALLDDGALRCWGDGASGQLGRGSGPSVGDDETPVDVGVVDLAGAEVDEVFSDALAEHTCARLDDGALRCWGRDDHGQLGLGDEGSSEGPPGDLPDVIVVEDPDDV